jgi:hypothetical protein
VVWRAGHAPDVTHKPGADFINPFTDKNCTCTEGINIVYKILLFIAIKQMIFNHKCELNFNQYFYEILHMRK